MNVICLVGNLTKDPETRDVSDTSVTRLRLAVNRQKPKGGGEAKTDYLDVNVWGPSGQACQRFLAKGSKVSVNGRLQIDEVDARDGSGKKYFTSVVANQVDFLTPKGEGGAPSSGAQPTAKDEDDLDF